VTQPSESQRPNFEQKILEKVLLATVEEQRRARRWSIFFKLAVLVYIAGAVIVSQSPFNNLFDKEADEKTAVIDVAGLIAPGQPASADNIIEALKDASADKKVKGIILRMNSPGGSPVQSDNIFETIRKIKKEKPELPIIAVVADLCASGCYYVASATDKIYVNNASVIGSIGVIMGSFGFVDAMKQLGIERRVMTAGDHKALLDPFAPVDPVAKTHMQGVLAEVHRQFITAVKTGRGDRLKETPDMFSGLVWTGGEGIKLGLADDLGDDRSVAETVIGAKKRVSFNPEENAFDRFTRKFGASAGTQVASEVLGLRFLPN
jgi:protease IV